MILKFIKFSWAGVYLEKDILIETINQYKQSSTLKAWLEMAANLHKMPVY